jgi:hypothetical protein
MQRSGPAMSPTEPASSRRAKPPKEWEREKAGTYRSADGRFTLEGDGAGRWFVRDAEETDELGLPRTIGPYPTLAAAKAAAVGHREHGPEPSPLVGKLKAAAGRTTAGAGRGAATDRASGESPPKPASRSRTGASHVPATAGGAPADGAATDGPAAGAAATTATRRTPERAPAPAPTWLDTLQAKDRDAARRARDQIRDLEALGIDDADGLVRRDVLGNQPEVARRLLAEALRRAMAQALDPASLVAAASRRKIRPAEHPEALATYVAARTVEAIVDVVAGSDRLKDASPRLPGWELVERGPGRRRLRLTADDLG